MNAKAQLSDLIDAWWKTAKEMNAMPDTASDSLKLWHAGVFESILIQCGWTTLEWNEAVVPKKENVA